MSTAKIIIGAIAFLFISFGTISFLMHKINQLEKDNERLSTNFANVNQQLQVVTDKNGELHANVKKLNLTIDELEAYSNETTEELKNMRIKLKRAKDINHIQTVVKYIRDTIQLEPDSLKFHLKNEWIDNSFRVDGSNVIDYRLSVRDSIMTVSEITYKGWWIFKRPKGVKLHVKSFNPYSNFESVQAIEIR